MAASDKFYHGEITSDETDWGTGDESTENKPCGGDAVQAYIKRKLKGKAGDFYYDQDTNMYLIFADEKDRDTYLSDRDGNAELLLGRFDAPANYTAEISMITPAMNVILSGQTGNKIQYTFDIKNKNGASTMEPVVATYTFNNAGNIQKITQIYNAGTTVEFLIDNFLGEGANSISVLITGRSSLASTMTAVNFTVVNLKLSSDFDFAAPVPYGGNISITYQLSGSNLKYLEWYVDGTLYGNPDSIADFSVTRTKAIPTSNLTVGKHNIQARAYINNNDTKYYSKTLYYDVVVAPSNGAWDSAKNFILLGLTLEEPRTSGVLSVAARQYEELPYKIATYNSTQTILEVTVKDGSTVIQTIAPQLETVQSMTYTPATDGTHTLTFVAGTDSVTVSAIVSATDVDIEEQTDGLLLKLTADGRSNSEANPATWTDRGITTLFNNFVWNGQSGWHDGRLVVPSGSSITVGLKPLASISKTTGKTIEIDYETSDITNEEANIINVVSGGAGLNVKPSSAKLQSAAGVNVNTRYRAGDRVHLSFIINPSSGPFANLAFIVNNGILERASRFDPSDTFASDNYLSIGKTDGTAGCTIKIKSIRVYDKALTPDEAFCNYAIDSGNLVEIANRNNIYGEGGGIDADKVNANIPIMIITGNIDNIMQINDKARKGEWNTYPVDIEYRNLADPSLNFTIEQADIRLQGTSSISYPRKNFRIYSKSKSKKYNTIMRDANGEVVEGGKYSFKHGSAPVTCWCLKADYAESSGSHNTGVARMWNKLMYNAACSSQEDIAAYGLHPLRTKAQTWADENHYPYDVRTTIDGFPIVLFQRETENSPLTCFGQYNFNNDKSTEDVYGFTELSYNDSTFDNSKVQCFEVLDSDNEIALFKNVSNFDSGWSDAFEGRYPDGTEDVAKLKAFCQWVNSCKNNLTKWKNEKAAHLDLPKLAAYYVYLLRFGAVDQTVKNAMLTTEDGEHFFFINYDNDTILGIDNASVLFDTWDYDLKSTNAQGGYYYAGRGESVLWNMFEADNECLALARKMDKLLYQAGLRYSEVCKMFDDEQSSQWCERIYNENGRYKYIEQAQAGANVLYMLQGSRKSYRHWWLQHRFDKYDNMWGGGSYTERLIQVRASSQGEQIHKDSTYTATAAITSYFGYALASTEVDPPTQRTAGETFTSTGLPQETLVGNLIYIYNADNLSMINVSGWLKGMGTLDVSKAVDVVGESRLRKLILGDGTKTNLNMTDISGLGKQKGLEELDIRGCKGIITLSELSTLTNLHVFNAANSGLTTFRPADGATLTSVTLPSTLQTLELNSNAITTLNYTPDTTLRNMTLRNVTGINTKTFVENWLNAIGSGDYSTRTLELQGVDWTDVDVDWLCGLAEKEWSSFRITGHAKVTGELTDEAMTRLENNFGSGCFSESAAFYVEVTAGMSIIGPDNVVEGDSYQYTARIFPTPEPGGTYVWDIIQGARNGTTLSSDGLLTTTETGGYNTNFVFRCRYYPAGSSSAQFRITKAVTVLQATYPYAPELVMEESVDSDTQRTYRIVQNTTTVYTGHLTYDWSLTGDAAEYATLTPSSDGSSAVLVFGSATGVAYMQGTVTCAVKKNTGVAIGSKTADFNIKDDTIAITKVENPYVMALMYSKGLAANENYMTKEECADVTINDVQPGNTSSSSIFYSNNNFRTKVTSFTEFQYFTGLTNIPPYLFYGCAIKSIILPNGITYINSYAFAASKIESITVPDGVTSTGTYVFSSCTSLRNVTLPEGLGSINYYVFNDCSSLVSVNIPNTVTQIGQSAFDDCSSLESIDIPEGVTTISPSAFYRCTKLVISSLPSSLTTLGHSAFVSCEAITSIRIPTGIQVVGENVFQFCTSLSSVAFYVTNGENTVKIYKYCFSGCTSLKVFDFSHVSSYSDYAFPNCGLESISIPAITTYIGNGAFYGCKELSSITVAGDNTRYDSREGCNAIIRKSDDTLICACKNTVIPNSVTGIGDFSFYGVEITSVRLPIGLTNIGGYAFEKSELTSITIPDGVTSIAEYAFQDCKSLVSVDMPSSLLSMNRNVFSGCSSLTSIEIPEGVDTIPDYAFYNCISLVFAKIPSSATNFKDSSFCRCTSLATLYVLASTPPNLISSAFNSMNEACTIYVPYGSVSAYKEATGWNDRKDYIKAAIENIQYKQLAITADDVSFAQTTTVVHLSWTVDGDDLFTGGRITNAVITEDVTSESFTKNDTYADRLVTITYSDHELTASTTITQGAKVDSQVSVNLNSQWQESSKNPDSTAYYAFESFSNYHVSNSVAKMVLTILGYTDFSFYIRSNGESGYDFVQVGKLDTEPVAATNPSTANTAYNTKDKSTSNTAIGNHTLCTFTNDGEQHTITIIYRKDGSGDNGDDKGYVLISKDYLVTIA